MRILRGPSHASQETVLIQANPWDYSTENIFLPDLEIFPVYLYLSHDDQ